MSTYTISQVGPSNQWDGQNGSKFVDYKLRLAGVEKVVVLTQKPESPVPQSGQVIDVDLSPHPKFSDLLKAKKVQQPRQGQGRSPEENARIMRQHSQEMALRLLAIQGKSAATAEDVKALADWFDSDAKAAQP